MARMRVVVLDHTAQEGGAELALVRLARRLRRAEDIDVRVALFARGPLLKRLADAGIPAVVVPLDAGVATASRDALAAGGAVRSALVSLAFVPRLVRAIRGSHADLVVANSLKSAVFAALAAPLAGRRWVWHLHDRLAADYLPAPVLAVMRMLTVVGPRHIVVNSQATWHTLPYPARHKAVVAYPGVDDEVFDVVAQPAETPVIGIVGRVSPTKGQRLFLLAAARVADRHPSARFRVIGGALFGEDDYADALAGLTRDEEIEDRVEFTGWVNDPIERMAELTALVHASPVPEPFGQVVAEAMAIGVPVIASAAGGVTEILADGDTGREIGLLVPPGDVAALADALDEVMSHPESARKRADAARRRAEDFRIGATAAVVRAVWSRSIPATTERTR